MEESIDINMVGSQEGADSVSRLQQGLRIVWFRDIERI
jgi:hypothetical protein